MKWWRNVLAASISGVLDIGRSAILDINNNSARGLHVIHGGSQSD